MTVSAVFQKGVFVPKEKVDLEENAEVRVIPVCRPGQGKSAWERHSLQLGAVPPPDFKSAVPEMEAGLE